MKLSLGGRWRGALSLVIFAYSMIGARDCDPWKDWRNPPPPPPPPPPPQTLPWCNTDPPVGCAAVCVAVDDVELTRECSDIGASTKEQKFAKDIQLAIDTLHDKDLDACPESQVGRAVTPCQDGILPEEWPGQDHENCAPPPPGCTVIGSP
jgi:hypothetical protein